MDLASVLITSGRENQRTLTSIDRTMKAVLAQTTKQNQAVNAQQRRDAADKARAAADRRVQVDSNKSVTDRLDKIIGHIDELEDKVDTLEKDKDKKDKGGLIGGLSGLLKNPKLAAALPALLKGTAVVGGVALGGLAIKSLVDRFMPSEVPEQAAVAPNAGVQTPEQAGIPLNVEVPPIEVQPIEMPKVEVQPIEIPKPEVVVVEKEPAQALQRGGPVRVPGTGSGDKVPAMLPPGSFVLNRNASNFLMRQKGGAVPAMLEPGELVFPKASQELSNFNSAVPRFQEGGTVSHPNTGTGYQPDGATDYKGRPVVLSQAAADSFAKMMQAGGVKGSDVTSSQRSPSYNSQIGGARNSHHLRGNAVDIHGGSKAWLKAGNAERFGWQLLDPRYTSHDGHFDYKGGGQGNTPESPNAQKEVDETNEKGEGREGKAAVAAKSEAGADPFGGFGGLLQLTGLLGDVSAGLAGLGIPGLSEDIEAFMNPQVNNPTTKANSSVDTETTGSGAPAGESNFKGSSGQWNPLLKLIADREAGSGGYEAMYPSTTLPGATKMTISEVAQKATGAVGMFQQLPQYLEGRARAIGLDPATAIYNEENQNKLAEYLIGNGQAGVTVDMAKNNPKEAMLRLSRVWAAIPKDDGGKSYYASDGVNKAHITPQEMYDVFETLQTGGIVGRQSGGMIPTLLEPGETVGTMEQWNKAIPRFQQGGTAHMGSMITPTSQNFYEKTDNMDAPGGPMVIMTPAPQPMMQAQGASTDSAATQAPALSNGPSMTALSDYINRVSWSSVF